MLLAPARPLFSLAPSVRTASGLLVLALTFGSGCGASPTPPAPRIHDVSDYLPQGATLVVLARPTALMAEASTRHLIESLFPSERLDAFRAHNGVDPRTLEAVAFARYATGTVIVARGPFNARVAVGEMAHRMVPVESESDEPYYRRAGLYAGARRDAIALDAHTLLFVTGAPSLSGLALSVTAPRALDDGDRLLASNLPPDFVALWPEPLGLPVDTGIGLVFAREEALAVSLQGAEGDVVLTAAARGEFPPGVEENLRALISSLSASDLGHQLGMADALRTLLIEVTPHGVSASARLSSEALARGLRALLVAELPEIMGAPAAR